MPFYPYNTPISLASPPVYNIVESGDMHAFSVSDENGAMIVIRVFREMGDQEGTMRLYNNVPDNSVQVAADSLEWVQIPDIPTDVWITGDLLTGTITFRAHLAVEPVEL